MKYPKSLQIKMEKPKEQQKYTKLGFIFYIIE
jgi:hypothetical protein